MGFTVTIEDIDTGWQKLARNLLRSLNTDMNVGVLKDPVVATYATVNEYGSDDGHVPERSFARAAFDANLPKNEALLELGIGRILDGDATPSEVLAPIGHGLVADNIDTILSFVPPPNAPFTISRKGFDHPLIETGDLVRAQDIEIITQEQKDAVAANTHRVANPASIAAQALGQAGRPNPKRAARVAAKALGRRP